MQWIFVGLGNPGGEYEGTRHNAGRFALENFNTKYGTEAWEYKKVYDARTARCDIGGKHVLLLLPETYMNESGRSLATLVKHPEQAEQTVILHDDIDLPLGEWRISFDRGAGGQKGVLSIMEHLKTKAFIRIRIGVLPKDEAGKGVKPKGGEEVNAFVLGKMRPDERAILEKVSDEIGVALNMLLGEGLEATMNKFNTR